MSAALAISVDVDGEAGLPDGGRHHRDRLTSRSERAYGLLRGLPRILRLLEDHGVHGTFYVPGVIARRHREEVEAILERGHEIGHHGHTHRRPDGLSASEQRAEVEDGLSALAACGITPGGYRAPAWEMTPVTLDLLAEHGFRWDSSLMGDDCPYVIPAGRRTLVELPVHWSLDDAPYFAASPDGAGLWPVWRAAVELAAAEDRALTLTLHPEILGRPHRLQVLERTLALARSLALPARTHGEIARGVG